MANNKIGFMTTEEFKTNIQEAIHEFAKGNFSKNSLELFGKLGYITERRAPLDKPTFEEFQETYISDQKFDKNKARVKEWKYVDLLFQLSREEVSQQSSLFDTKQVDKTIIETYLFFALELSGDDYNRTDLSNITREINRLFPMPVMVLFRHGNKLTFAVINRRLHKRDESKDVLEKVTLIKDISIESPLRAHIEILFDLSFQELLNKHQFTNFVELHNAWQKTLDTKELNKRFYSELFNWYLWAVQSVRFPNDVNDDKDDNVYNAESVIRLLTRLIFVWFIKEKKLVPETLFNVKKLKTILKDLKPESEKTSVYYRAILQNLFFATLNTPMDKDITDENKDEKRRFINTLPKTGNDQYLDQTKYRYQDYFINPDKALELFATIPFLNGGLFECLDFKEGNKEIRFDGFSSNEKRQAFVPDKLFFADEFILDLNAEYGTKGKKYKVEGLINLLDSYKFTIAENTPLEEEIALDPELLGKVFENLLASYNPETQTTARKQTGSFYTPREIVNYMVDESLIAYFKHKMDNSDETEQRLRDLFAHTIDLPKFSKAENNALIKAISEAKILDPACGSGAFPMGVLHRLVDLLNKLDPENKHWNDLQKQRALTETAEVFDSGETEERKIRLDEINKAFDLSMNYPDYARKLFLIENCIYGVDIQQIAIQISKLRFFISLIVDQKVNDSKPNRNILSMPNLETKFVAANTLIGLDKPTKKGDMYSMMSDDVSKIEQELASIRHKIFFTRKYSAKKALKKKEKEKREELQTALTQSGFSKNMAGQIAGWNPFDPMQSAKFFDSETMFGFDSGFDVCIGNPPYVNIKGQSEETKQALRKNYKYSKGADIYVAFIEKSLQFNKLAGSLFFIVPNKFFGADYGKAIREYLNTGDVTILSIWDLKDEKVFENAMISTIVIGFKKEKKSSNTKLIQGETTRIVEELFDVEGKIQIEANENDNVILAKLRLQPQLQTIADVRTGVMGFEYWKMEPIIHNGLKKNSVRLYTNGNLSKYSDKWETKSIKLYKDEYSQPSIELNKSYLNSNTIDLFKYRPKIIVRGVSKEIASIIDENGSGLLVAVHSIIPRKIDIKYLLGLINSKLLNWFHLNTIYSIRIPQGSLKYPTSFFETLPIAIDDSVASKKVIALVERITEKKAIDSDADITKLEKQIDELVYKLYDLTEEEIQIIEENV
jgi:adenine-specific DNA-methyltransferase